MKQIFYLLKIKLIFINILLKLHFCTILTNYIIYITLDIDIAVLQPNLITFVKA